MSFIIRRLSLYDAPLGLFVSYYSLTFNRFSVIYAAFAEASVECYILISFSRDLDSISTSL